MRATTTALLSVAALGFCSVLVMRWDLATPGLSRMLVGPDGRTGGAASDLRLVLGSVHGTASLCLAALAGCLSARVARRAGVPMAGTVALLAAVAAVLLPVGAAFGPSGPLRLSLSDLPRADLLPLGLAEAITPARLVTLATAFAGLGAVMLAAALPGFGWTGPMMAVLTLIAAALILWRPEAGAPAAVPPLLTLLAVTSMQLMEEDRPATPYLWCFAAFGLGLFGWASVALGESPAVSSPAALWHLAAATSALLVSLAAFNRLWSPALPGWILWSHAAGVAALAVGAFAPMLALGQAGLPPGAPDLARDHAALEAEARGWGAALIAWWLAGVLMLARGRRDRQATPAADVTPGP
ncbi:hypothetical protein [Histidinibacterium lentulum]|uniref:DUF998 domain-containing protein n=1 Tax=Histidinibacterium lentulum TaxID=2480588 RepID=A0A3N2RA52_9RHOB|nr:hypothetical protein [Histidinibacterium lentulum]ROU04281.1 hypothetical protein EAT49_02510 [Histidinibacterium lentulum]